MPTYQYACTACDERLEVVQKFTDDPLTQCPACEGRLRKLFSPVGVVFKGSGFYRTDSRAAAKSGNGKDGGSSANGTGSSGGESTTSTDSGKSSSSTPSTGSTSKATPAPAA